MITKTFSTPPSPESFRAFMPLWLFWKQIYTKPRSVADLYIVHDRDKPTLGFGGGVDVYCMWCHNSQPTYA